MCFVHLRFRQMIEYGLLPTFLSNTTNFCWSNWIKRRREFRELWSDIEKFRELWHKTENVVCPARTIGVYMRAKVFPLENFIRVSGQNTRFATFAAAFELAMASLSIYIWDLFRLRFFLLIWSYFNHLSLFSLARVLMLTSKHRTVCQHNFHFMI